eukprot:7382082-Prymnesium_polylepis.2
MSVEAAHKAAALHVLVHRLILLSQLAEGVDDDTGDDVEENDYDDDEEEQLCKRSASTQFDCGLS